MGFFASNFHEDWNLEASTAEGVLELILRYPHQPGELERLADLIDDYASRFVEDEALERALTTELGAYYLPTSDGWSAHGWLKHVSSMLRFPGSPRNGRRS
ncbi:MAG: hypothetical protein HOV81_33425 [Kofleriaceae bacterium]|nr:hypothetical protein [Kofleriaceae bacterium]